MTEKKQEDEGALAGSWASSQPRAHPAGVEVSASPGVLDYTYLSEVEEPHFINIPNDQK